MPHQQPRNPSAKRHAEWQVRGVVGLAAHVGVGASGQMFEFRRRGESATYPFVFVGLGLGAGPQLGAGSAGFATPHEFVWETGKIIGRSFWEAGRQMLGAKPQVVPQPSYAETIGEFVDIESSSFSAIDLDRAMGRLTCASASLALGYAITYITAFKLDQVFFESQSTAGEDIVGGTTGVSLGANMNAGMWFHMR